MGKPMYDEETESPNVSVETTVPTVPVAVTETPAAPAESVPTPNSN
jgi:hypothetical protein